MEKCAICLNSITNPKELRCKHRFCEACVYECFSHGSRLCPVCKAVCGTVIGNQPPGTMTEEEVSESCPGYEGWGTIVILYRIRDGIQQEGHPNPGRPFRGARRRAYLPNNPEGREILKLLRKAFDQRLIFTVGRSMTTGRDNVVTWNDIHHKTSMNNPHRFGYPDPTYLARVREELKDKGITTD